MTDNISEQGFELVLNWVRNNDSLFVIVFWPRLNSLVLIFVILIGLGMSLSQGVTTSLL